MTSTTITGLVVFLLPLAYSPGPGNMFFALVGGRFGIGGAMPSLIGYHVATFIVTLALGYGAAVTFLSSPLVARGLVMVSALYLFWIALAYARTALYPVNLGGLADKAPDRADAPGFWAGAILLLFNPKAYAIIAAMFAAFATAQSDIVELAAITMIFTLNNMIAFLAWAAMGKLLLGPLESRTANAVYALSFFGVALWMLLR